MTACAAEETLTPGPAADMHTEIFLAHYEYAVQNLQHGKAFSGEQALLLAHDFPYPGRD